MTCLNYLIFEPTSQWGIFIFFYAIFKNLLTFRSSIVSIILNSKVPTPHSYREYASSWLSISSEHKVKKGTSSVENVPWVNVNESGYVSNDKSALFCV